jgi:hypothetical protein
MYGGRNVTDRNSALWRYSLRLQQWNKLYDDTGYAGTDCTMVAHYDQDYYEMVASFGHRQPMYWDPGNGTGNGSFMNATSTFTTTPAPDVDVDPDEDSSTPTLP